MEKAPVTLMKRLTDLVGELENRQTRIKRALTSYKKSGGTSDLFAARLWLEANSEVMEKDLPELGTLASEIGNPCKDTALQFEADLRDVMTNEGWNLSGQWPSYYAEYVIPVLIDEKKFSVTVGEEKIPTLSPKAITVSLGAQMKKLRVERAKLPEFLSEIYENILPALYPAEPHCFYLDHLSGVGHRPPDKKVLARRLGEPFPPLSGA